MSCQENTSVFLFKVWREERFSHESGNLFGRKEASAIEFFGGMGRNICHQTEDMYQFSLALALENIACEHLRTGDVGDANLLSHFALQGCVDVFVPVDMSAYGSIPLVGLDILPCRAVLQIEFSAGIEDVEVDNGVQRFAVGAGMRLAACGVSHNTAFGVHHWKEFVCVIVHHSSGLRSRRN